MIKQYDYKLPVVVIEKTIPLLERDNIVYATEIHAKLLNGKKIIFYENTGLNLDGYIGEKMECVLEITEGNLFYPPYSENVSTYLPCEYIWPELGFIFFPDLKKIREEMENADIKLEDELEDIYEKKAIEVYNSFGLKGFGFDIYSYYSMIMIYDCIFYLNEYEFEQDIDDLEVEDEFYIDVFEIYLRGVRPYIPPEDIEEEVELTEAQKAEKARRAAQQERSRIAHEQMQERIRKRREAGEGPGFSVV